MTFDSRSVETVLLEAKNLLAQEASVSPALLATLNVLLALVAALLQRLNLHGRNSSKPPSTDPNRPGSPRPKGPRPAGRQAGRQNGHVGKKTLQRVDEPDVVSVLAVDRHTLPEGDYRPAGFEKRLVFDLDIAPVVTEYRAEILADCHSGRFTASFPAGVSNRVQYGPAIKAHAVHLSQQPLLPYNRVEEYFREQLHIPISTGSLFNFNREAFEQLAPFEP